MKRIMARRKRSEIEQVEHPPLATYYVNRKVTKAQREEVERRARAAGWK